jgi:hypothetical protein
MTQEYKIDPNTTTEYVMHLGPDITVYVIQGKCTIETIYNSMTLSVEKGEKESYIIQEKVEYRLQNTCNYPCVLRIISELDLKDAIQNEKIILYGT